MALRENRIAGERHVRSPHRVAPEHHFAVLIRRAPLGADQIVLPILAEDVRRLDPDRLLREVDAAVHDQLARADHPLSGDVELLQPDRTMPLVEWRSDRRAVVHDVGLTVVVDRVGERREKDRIRPRALRIFRRDEEVATPIDDGVDQVEGAVVISDRRREETSRDAGAVQIELGRSVEHVADLRPRHEILAVEDRDPWEVREARDDEVVVVADAHHARIGIEAGKDRIEILVLRRRDGLVDRVVADVLEPLESRIAIVGDGSRLLC